MGGLKASAISRRTSQSQGYSTLRVARWIFAQPDAEHRPRPARRHRDHARGRQFSKVEMMVRDAPPMTSPRSRTSAQIVRYLAVGHRLVAFEVRRTG